ncbi:hypothetical protein P171DRAFT_471720 [Karstenula rhodostoma CBS 690.94]|uniref:F-box domain-containing protein n=1 Tax=Karstenula rhodostoma CBS 690.94 TaxID=1392251 RepID=A0A9P4PKY5_9PLEO|nr:hypothetical protein P171DRAFT_471720 [Karstenula rhodostoma CBS 690.94]
MTSLEALPNELLARIISFSDRRSLSRLRLTCKRLEEIAVAKVFERVTLYAHWANDGDKEEGEKTVRDSQSPDSDPGRYIHDDNYGHDSEHYATGTISIEKSMRAMQEYEEDGFIAGSDEEEKEGSISESDPQEEDRRYTNQTYRRVKADDEDVFVAGSDMDGDELDHRARPRRESSRQEQPSAAEASNRPPRPDIFSESLSDFQLYEKKRQQEWEAARPQWARENFPGPPDYDAAAFLNILENERLRKFVKEVQVYTCETHCDHHPKTGHGLYQDSWPRPKFHRRYLSSIQRLGEFPNVCGLTVHFDRHAAEGAWKEDIFQGNDFQHVVLEKIIEAAKESTSHLAVRHLENPQLREGGELDMPRLLLQVASASSLRLSVKHAEMHPGAGTTYRDGNIHHFWETFPALFLLPASNTLTALVLYSDIPLGWFPKLDLQGVHLPKLASLTLGHHILHHNRQVDWIISHEATLRELIFDRCAILYQIGCTMPDWFDDDGYPRKEFEHIPGEYGYSNDPDDEEPEEFERTLFFKSNHLRWSTVFSRLASSLPHLHEFRFGTSSLWDFDTTTTHFRAGATTHLPIMPWEDEHNIKSALFEERYVIWDDWQNEYRPKWMEMDRHGRDEFGVGWRDEWLALAEEYPLCEREDREALQVLVETAKSR